VDDPQAIYRRLTAEGAGDPFDRHVFACALAIGTTERERPLTHALGLSAPVLSDLRARYFPSLGDAALWPLPGDVVGGDAGEDALEEPDLRGLLLDHRSRGAREEEWLAAVVARRSVRPNHLWQDLGLPDRRDLNRLLHRHFGALARQNDKDMKWKKFFYRALCERDGIAICKAPNCEVCADVGICFGEEAGEPLARLQGALSRNRQT
jgi:nitrogen fixation protein NifQ